MSYSDSEEDEDVKVRRKLDRKERIEQDPISIDQTLLEKSGLSQAELKEIQEIFQLVDLDHSGAIDHNELMSLMNTLGLRFNVSEVENIISEADADNTGEIDFEAFVLTVSKKVATQYTRRDLLTAFKRFDNSTNDGKIPMTRMIDMLTKFGEKEKRLSRDEAIDLINQVSSDKQGDQFDYLQFLSVYFK